MNNQLLFVPVIESVENTADETESQVSLHKVKVYPTNPIDAWLINGIKDNIIKKISAYFELHPDAQDIPLAIILDNPKPIFDFTGSMQSITLGLFLGVMRFLRHMEFRINWETIIVTGDILPHSGNVFLYPVDGIKEKYAGVKAYAEQNRDQTHLFLYVGDPSEPLEPLDNVEIKPFSPDQDIEDVLCYLFGPSKEQLINRMDFFSSHLTDYILTDGLEKLKARIKEKGKGGFLLHGEGESGKSTLARALTGYLMSQERMQLYAPLWLKIDIDNYIEHQKEHLAYELPVENCNLHKTANGYLIRLFAELLQCDDSEVTKSLKDKRYIIIIDNLERQDQVKSILEELKDLDTKLGIANKHFVIITSLSGCDDLRLLECLGIIDVNITSGEFALTRPEIEELIEKTAGHKTELKNYLEKVKNDESYNKFIEVLHKEYSSFPGLIKTAVSCLIKSPLDKLIQQITSNSGVGEEQIWEQSAAMYKTAFSQLEPIVQQFLFIIIRRMKPDVLKTQEEIREYFNEWLLESVKDTAAVAKKYDEIKESYIIFEGKEWYLDRLVSDDSYLNDYCDSYEEKFLNALNMLVDYNVMYIRREPKDIRYGIKSLPYLIYMFHSDYKGDECNAYNHVTREMFTIPLRDVIIDKDLRLLSALTYDLPYKMAASLFNVLDDYWNNEVKNNFLFLAAKNSDPNIIKELLRHGCNVDGPFLGFPAKWTILHVAASLNTNVKVVKELVKHYQKNNLDINPKDEKGAIPLHYACRYNNAEVIRVLLDSDKTKRSLYTQDNDGVIPLHLAIRDNNEEVVKQLIAIYKECNNVRKMENDNEEDIFEYALVLSTLNPNPQVAITLIEEGAGVNAVDSEGTPALDYLKKHPQWNIIKARIPQ